MALCVAVCAQNNQKYAGVEYAGECCTYLPVVRYPNIVLIITKDCGNTFNGGGGPAPDGFSGCNKPCNGNSSEYCGGANRLDMYQAPGTGATPTSSSTKVSSPATTSSSSKTASATATSAATGLPSGWVYKGCYVDNANGRVLPAQALVSSTLTVESCVQACSGQGYSVAGMEYSTECYCGNAIYSGGALAPSDSDCSMACGGNANEKCGAGNRLSIYSNGTLTTYQPAVAQTSGLPGSWTYDGCYK